MARKRVAQKRTGFSGDVAGAAQKQEEAEKRAKARALETRTAHALAARDERPYGLALPRAARPLVDRRPVPQTYPAAGIRRALPESELSGRDARDAQGTGSPAPRPQYIRHAPRVGGEPCGNSALPR